MHPPGTAVGRGSKSNVYECGADGRRTTERALRSLRCVRRHFDRLDNRGIVILGLVDPRRNRPHPHRSGREWAHEVARVGLLTQPTSIVTGRQNERHPVVNLGHELVGVGGDDGERPNPFARSRLFPVLPNPGKPERRAVLHGDRVGLLRLLALDRLPFEEPVHRHDAATHSIGIAERGQIPHALALGVDRLAAALRITAPIRNQTPPQRIERYLAGPVIAADDQQVLARRAVPPRRIVVHAAIAHVHAIDDGIAKRPAALDDPPTHGEGYSYRSARLIALGMQKSPVDPALRALPTLGLLGSVSRPVPPAPLPNQGGAWGPSDTRSVQLKYIGQKFLSLLFQS